MSEKSDRDILIGLGAKMEYVVKTVDEFKEDYKDTVKDIDERITPLEAHKNQITGAVAIIGLLLLVVIEHTFNFLK